MIKSGDDPFLELKKIISRLEKTVNEIELLSNYFESSDKENAKTIKQQIDSLERILKSENKKLPELVEKIHLQKKLENTNEKKVQRIAEVKEKKSKKKGSASSKTVKGLKITKLEKDIIKRLGHEKEKVSKKKDERASFYVGFSSRLFSNLSRKIIEKKIPNNVIKDLLKTNIKIVPTAYVSVMLFTVLIAFGLSLIAFLFFSFFQVVLVPFSISIAGNIITRLLTNLWILLVLPIGTALFMYFYPSMEKSSIEQSINQELPFATINMSAIAGSMVEPTNIFSIIISTGEYPNLKKEFTKVINEINIYGRDLVAALRSSALSSPSKKLAEIYNGLATTITSGGNLADFLDKRAETLLLDYRLERERYTKTAETFIDIYISVVIAAPMILMLLLMMMQISGLGIALSSSAISLIMVFGVSIINFVFLMFLHLKQPTQ